MKTIYQAYFSEDRTEIRFSEAELLDEKEYSLLIRITEPAKKEPRWDVKFGCAGALWHDIKHEAVSKLARYSESLFSYTIPIYKEYEKKLQDAIDNVEDTESDPYLYCVSHINHIVQLTIVELLPNHKLRFIRWACSEQFLPDNKTIELTWGDRQLRGPKDGRRDVILAEPEDWFTENKGYFSSKKKALEYYLTKQNNYLYNHLIPQAEQEMETVEKWYARRKKNV